MPTSDAQDPVPVLRLVSPDGDVIAAHPAATPLQSLSAVDPLRLRASARPARPSTIRRAAPDTTAPRDPAVHRRALEALEAARARVRHENLAAATATGAIPALTPTSSPAADDPRLGFAVRVAQQLEGGRAALLRPERRRRLLREARRLGLRPFDAHLIVAIVQDGARRRTPAHTPDLDASTTSRLALVHHAERRPRATMPWISALTAVALGLAGASALTLWLLTAR